MKNITKGKLALVGLVLAIVSNAIVYISMNGNPFSVPFYNADGWTLLTGLSIGVTGLFSLILLIMFIITNWDNEF